MHTVSHRLALAAAVAGLAGCGGRDANPPIPATGDATQPAAAATLRSAPEDVAATCRALARWRTLAVLCPTRLPRGRWTVSHPTLRDGRCAYLLDLNARPFGRTIPFHALAGGRCGSWPLTTGGGRWPAGPPLADDLGLIGAKPLRPGQPGATTPIPVRPRVLRRVVIAGHRGLVVQAAIYPEGGVHGGHIAAIWNQGTAGYVLSLHFTERPHAATPNWEQTVIDAAEAMSRSSGHS